MKSTTFTTKISDILYNDNDAGESFSSVSLNPTFAWVKFVLTDDQPNGNNQRIPKSEFANLIRTGIYAPIKMGVEGIKEDHSDAFPLGVITHLKEDDNKIVGIAALWSKEREEDIRMLREMYATGNLPQLSWEMLYQESKVDDNGVEDLLDLSLRATTIVSAPAYTGRTPIFAMASKQTNSDLEEQKVEELEKALAKIKELEEALSAKDKELESKASDEGNLKAELEALREYKESAESEKKASLRFEEIKNKFAEAKLEKDENYFSEKKAFLLGLSDEAIDFMIQEMVSFSSAFSSQNKENKNPKIPNLVAGSEDLETDPRALAKELLKRLSK